MAIHIVPLDISHDGRLTTSGFAPSLGGSMLKITGKGWSGTGVPEPWTHAYAVGYAAGANTGNVTLGRVGLARSRNPVDLPMGSSAEFAAAVTAMRIRFGMNYRTSIPDDTVTTTFGATQDASTWDWYPAPGGSGSVLTPPGEPWSKPFPLGGSGTWNLFTTAIPFPAHFEFYYGLVNDGPTIASLRGWDMFSSVVRNMGADFAETPVYLVALWLEIEYTPSGPPEPPAMHVWNYWQGKHHATYMSPGWAGGDTYGSPLCVFSGTALDGSNFKDAAATWKVGDTLELAGSDGVARYSWTLTDIPGQGSGYVTVSLAPSTVATYFQDYERIQLRKAAPPIPNGTGHVTADVTLTGTGTSLRTGTGALTVDVTTSGSGSRRSAGTGAVSADVTLVGTGALPVPTYSGTGHVSAAAALAGAGQRVAAGTGAVSAAATLSSTGATVRTGTGHVTAAATLSSTGATVRTGTGHVTAAVTLTGSGQAVAGAGQGTGHLTVSVALAGAGSSVRAGTGALTASVVLAGAGSSVRAGTGALTASVVLAGSGVAVAPSFSGTGALLVAVGLFGEGITLRLGGGALTALVTLDGFGRLPVSTAEIFNGTDWVGMDTWNGTRWATAEVWNHLEGEWQQLSAPAGP